jgi:hypothetical protein
VLLPQSALPSRQDEIEEKLRAVTTTLAGDIHARARGTVAVHATPETTRVEHRTWA